MRRLAEDCIFDVWLPQRHGPGKEPRLQRAFDTGWHDGDRGVIHDPRDTVRVARPR